MIIFHGNSMNRVIILYAPDTPELTQAADKIKRALAPEDFNVEVKASKQGSIQDLAASDLIIRISRRSIGRFQVSTSREESQVCSERTPTG
jgi:hypothetical protein